MTDGIIKLDDVQVNAINKMKNGCILVGDTGSGKSRTALAYFYIKVCDGLMGGFDGEYEVQGWENPRDLYIITTAKKRDDHEWESEMEPFYLKGNIKIVIDSWNNITKYKMLSR